MQLTSDQKIAFDEIIEFLKKSIKPNSDDCMVHTLIGYAGSGKTTLTRFLTDWCNKNNMTYAGVAPTHKAKKVLENILNKDSFIENSTFTVAKFLNKIRNHGYVASKNFTGNYMDRHYDLYIVDECSMISDRDVDDLIKVAKLTRSKILFVGDRAQIPNPSQKYSQNGDGTVSKKDSKAFDFPSSILTTIIRQSHSNPLLDVYTKIREDLMVIPKINRITTIIGGKGVQYYTDQDRFYDKIRKVFRTHQSDIEKYRIITYTNDMVRFYNNLVRKTLEYAEQFVVGEILMGYSNSELVENGQEYIIKKVEHQRTTIRHDKLEHESIGYLIYVSKDRESLEIENVKLFFPDITKKENMPILNKLKELADKVNKKGSTRKDYIDYIQLKSQIYFIENVFNFGGKIMNESTMKSTHPRLFENVNSYIVNKRPQKSNKLTSLLELYPDIIDERIADAKPIGDAERLCDRFQIIEKDLDYGYAITVHKSQGITSEKVFVDECDFKKIQDKWNHLANAMENGIKERNQLLYVALTRPTHIAYVLYDDV
jgi:hypothetical protein